MPLPQRDRGRQRRQANPRRRPLGKLRRALRAVCRSARSGPARWRAMTDEARASPAQPDDAHRAAMRAATKRIDRVDERLHVGGAISPDDYGRFLELGITHVIDLREASEDDSNPARLQELGIARLQVPVPNQGTPRLDQLQEIVTWLDSCPGSSVAYVHCGGGFGR